MKLNISATLRIALAAAGSLICASAASAAPLTSIPPYILSVFATTVGHPYTGPDSIVQWRNSILVGFQNGAAKDGSAGSSTIVQYSLTGTVQRTFTIIGRNDGLRLVGEDHLWCLFNEDANPKLVVIDLESGDQKPYTFAPTAHGGGFDDMVVINGQVYMTASNPSLDPNIFPALVRAIPSGSQVAVVYRSYLATRSRQTSQPAAQSP